MKKIVAGSSVALAALFGTAACVPVPVEEPVAQEAPLEHDEPTPEAETPEVVTLKEGDTNIVPLDDYGDSYTVTIEDVRYLDEIVATEYVPEGETITAYDGTGVFAVVDMTFTNDEDQQQEFMSIFETGAYEDSEGNTETTSYNEAFTPEDPDGYNVFNAPDVDARNLLMEEVIPAGATTTASEVIPVPEKSGYLYSADGTYRLELPEK